MKTKAVVLSGATGVQGSVRTEGKSCLLDEAVWVWVWRCGGGGGEVRYGPGPLGKSAEEEGCPFLGVIGMG